MVIPSNVKLSGIKCKLKETTVPTHTHTHTLLMVTDLYARSAHDTPRMKCNITSYLEQL